MRSKTSGLLVPTVTVISTTAPMPSLGLVVHHQVYLLRLVDRILVQPLSDLVSLEFRFRKWIDHQRTCVAESHFVKPLPYPGITTFRFAQFA